MYRSMRRCMMKMPKLSTSTPSQARAIVNPDAAAEAEISQPAELISVTTATLCQNLKYASCCFAPSSTRTYRIRRGTFLIERRIPDSLDRTQTRVVPPRPAYMGRGSDAACRSDCVERCASPCDRRTRCRTCIRHRRAARAKSNPPVEQTVRIQSPRTPCARLPSERRDPQERSRGRPKDEAGIAQPYEREK